MLALRIGEGECDGAVGGGEVDDREAPVAVVVGDVVWEDYAEAGEEVVLWFVSFGAAETDFVC